MTAKRVMDPNTALDFPHIEPDKWILWSASGYAWPDARRNVAYLSDQRRSLCGRNAAGEMKWDPEHGFALFSGYDVAATFDTEEAAQTFLKENEARRPHPYGVNVTTVQELIDRKFNGGKPLP